MAGSVEITHPLRRLIYINGDYMETAGLSPGPFVVETGDNTFETMRRDGTVDNRKTVNVANRARLKIFLDPV